MNFVVELTTISDEEKPKGPITSDEARWMLNVNGSIMNQANRAGIILIPLKGQS